MPNNNKKNKGTPKKKTGQKKKGRRRSTRRRIFIILLVAFLAGLVLFSLFFMAVYFGFTGHVPTTAQLYEIKNPQASEVYSEDEIGRASCRKECRSRWVPC